MTVLLWCLLVAVLLPYAGKVALVFAMARAPSGYDNTHPRAQQDALTGWGARARAAHYNEFEALLVFAACSLGACAAGRPDALSGWLGLTYLAARVSYHVCYLKAWSTARSTLWTVGLGASVAILARALL